MENYRPAVIKGVAMAIFSILIFLILYAIDPMIYAKPAGWAILLVGNFLAIPIVFLILGVRDTKKNFSVFTFGTALSAGMVTGIISVVVVLLFNAVFLTIIDPEWEQQLSEEVMVSTQELMEKMGAPDDTVEEAMQKARDEAANQPKGIIGQMKSSLGSLGWYLILSLIIAAVYRDKAPKDAEATDEIVT